MMGAVVTDGMDEALTLLRELSDNEAGLYSVFGIIKRTFCRYCDASINGTAPGRHFKHKPTCAVARARALIDKHDEEMRQVVQQETIYAINDWLASNRERFAFIEDAVHAAWDAGAEWALGQLSESVNVEKLRRAMGK